MTGNIPITLPTINAYRRSPLTLYWHFPDGYVLPTLTVALSDEYSTPLADTHSPVITALGQLISASWTADQVADMPDYVRVEILHDDIVRQVVRITPTEASNVGGLNMVLSDGVNYKVTLLDTDAVRASQANASTATQQANLATQERITTQQERSVATQERIIAQQEAGVSTDMADAAIAAKNTAVEAKDTTTTLAGQVTQDKADVTQMKADTLGFRNESEGFKNAAEGFKTEAETILSAVQQGKFMGTFNATTGIISSEEIAIHGTTIGAAPPVHNPPTLNFPDGSYLKVGVSGVANFAGKNFSSGQAMGVDDTLWKLGAAWFLAPASSLALAKALALEGLTAKPRMIENLLPNSEDLSTWPTIALPPTASAIPGPDGLGLLWQLTETSANSNHWLSTSANVVSGKPYAFSVFVKVGVGRDRVWINMGTTSLWAGGITPSVVADLTNLAILAPSTTVQDSGIVDCGDGIYRIWLRATPVASGSTAPRFGPAVGTSNSYAGDPANYIYAGFPQLTQTSRPANYHPSTGTAVSKVMGVHVTPAEKSLIATPKITDWIAQGYAVDSQVYSAGRLWKNTSAALSTDVPGTSTKWVPLAYKPVQRPYLLDYKADFSPAELGVLDVIQHVEVDYADPVRKNDIFHVRALTRNHTTGFENYIEIHNETAGWTVSRNFSAGELSAGYAEISVSAQSGYSGQSIRVWFNYANTTRTGLILSSSDSDYRNVRFRVKGVALGSLATDVATIQTRQTSQLAQSYQKPWLESPLVSLANVSSSQRELEVANAIINIHIPPPDFDNLNDRIVIRAFCNNDPTFGYLIEIRNETSGENMVVTPTSSERTAKKWTRELTFRGHKGNFATFEIDYSLLTTTGVILSSSRTNPEPHIRIQRPPQNQWFGKTIYWYGTSIPENAVNSTDIDRSYPNLLGRRLGAKVVNVAKAGLSAILDSDGTIYQYGSLSAYLSEYANAAINDLGVNYTTGRNVNVCFENTLIGKNADLYVFDCVPNVNNFATTDWDAFNFTTGQYSDGATFDARRKTYYGAMLFLLRKLYTDKPNARVAFVSEYPEDNTGVVQTENMSLKLSIPHLKVARDWRGNAFNSGQYFFDTVHPTQYGQYKIADALYGKFLTIS